MLRLHPEYMLYRIIFIEKPSKKLKTIHSAPKEKKSPFKLDLTVIRKFTKWL